MGTTAKSQRWAGALAFALCLLFSAAAAAQDSKPAGSSFSVEDRAEAAEAYDRGTSAYLSESYELAAHWFERAHRLVPTSTALLQAVRAHHKAGNSIQAANLALRLRDEYPSDVRSKQIADAVIEAVQPANVLIEARCEKACTLELDGALIEHPTFFATPDVEHSLKAPAAPSAPPVPRWAFFSSLGATVALGAVAAWSGIDANKGVSAYESAARSASSPGINNGTSPTPQQQAQALLEEGRQKERRTNILIGVTAAMAATTAVLGVFTNWKGEARDATSKRVEPAIGVSTKGGTLMLKGRF
ncbi:MAG: hypothetical protein JRF54_15275 [Deltaproteobacteria bacterium]|nr:hypothetical protein [Deltaproteobacteria bacterium]